jgi:NADH-quinone oxidoreductase subunit L
MADSWLFGLGLCVIVSPAWLVAALGIPSLLGRPLSEFWIQRLTYLSTIVGLIAAVGVLAIMLSIGTRFVPIELGHWVNLPDEHFHFHLKFIFDRLSVPFVILSYLLCGTIGAFTSRYLHREKGYARFYICYSLFTLGMVATSLAGTIEVLFFGWELVGLSSALLVAFFHERVSPVRNGLRVWTVYRFADAAFLIAALALHHLTGEGDFEGLMGRGSWPDGVATLTSQQALLVGLLLLIAAAGKSALIPFSGWLPRAMEGPTPSSAIFYGALSVHLGAFLLLRVSPLLELSMVLAVTVIAVGLSTAVLANLVERVQTDIKSALAYASLTQVGIIVAEIGFGLYYIALIHILGHACLRTLQLLRAPTLLQDYHVLENAIGGHLTRGSGGLTQKFAGRSRDAWYRLAFVRGNLDSLLDQLLVGPFYRVFEWCDAQERRWTDFLAGSPSRVSLHEVPSSDATEEQGN